MTNFFKNRAPVQLAGDVAIGALGNARKGLFGTLLLSAAENSIPTVGSIATMAGACALGGALLIIPAMAIRKMLISELQPNASFLAMVANSTANLCFRTAFSVTSACVGAAVLGLAMTPAVLTSLTASLTFGLIGFMAALIVEAARPTKEQRVDLQAMNVAF
ncbi:Uncharacterised protein [Legionella donaldsonii]|uniref:Uncharacterized protein n=1 Tax=Legionella donaldsonii TaxID=45060 RepID=A0A378J1P3_9GAMM|nr:hypothetical protein [Legionella donaldsonii]STX41664.1 Uncharacterised protein [Legionella donaldsonii]